MSLSEFPAFPKFLTEPVLGEPVQIAEKLYILSIPMSFHPGHVHVYLLEDDDGFVVFDTGHIAANCEEAWQRFLESDLGSKGIKQIMLTHTHPDHSGKAEWLWQQTGAALWMAETELDAVRRLWRNSCKHPKQMAGFFAQWGVPEEHFVNILSMFKGFRAGTSDFKDTPIHFIQSDQTFEWADQSWQAIFTHGHTPCNVCFYQQDLGYMVTGDQVLPSIFPNISVWWGSDENPLQLYLSSLLRLRQYPAQFLLPSHGMPFDNLEKRLDLIVQFHHRRLQRLLKFLSNKPQTAYDSVKAILPKSDKGWTISLVVGQVFALLRFLEGKGLVEQTGDDVWYFQSKPNAVNYLGEMPELQQAQSLTWA